MKNLRINKKGIISIILAMGLSISSRSGIVKGDNINDSLFVSNSFINSESINNDLSLYYRMIDNYDYIPIHGNNKFWIPQGKTIYFYRGDTSIDKVTVDSNIEVIVNETNHYYAKIILPNGDTCYTDISSLNSCDKLDSNGYIVINNDKDSAVSINSYLYDSAGHVIKYLYNSQECNKVATNGKYTLITLPDGSDGFILSDTLMNKYENVSKYALIKEGVEIYYDSSLTALAYRSKSNQVVYLKYINDLYASLYDKDGRELMYVRTNDLIKNFIDIDLNEQKMTCFIDYQFVNEWNTRSGKNTTPTHEGLFDIDWKAYDWEFTSYPGSYAKYWIPFNEFDEGIHDLVGDDEENYGNNAYQLNGSHGCVRVPAMASEFVYDNYDVGDMVLVRKK